MNLALLIVVDLEVAKSVRLLVVGHHTNVVTQLLLLQELLRQVLKTDTISINHTSICK